MPARSCPPPFQTHHFTVHRPRLPRGGHWRVSILRPPRRHVGHVLLHRRERPLRQVRLSSQRFQLQAARSLQGAELCRVDGTAIQARGCLRLDRRRVQFHAVQSRCLALRLHPGGPDRRKWELHILRREAPSRGPYDVRSLHRRNLFDRIFRSNGSHQLYRGFWR